MTIKNHTVQLLSVLAFAFICENSNAQNSTFSTVDNLNPVTPTAFQFVKYDQLPVSEYTGIPNISIPIYQIEEDGVKIPIDLSYHASGNRVNEEASWVGLGWDLSIGSIVQNVNDQDDLASSMTRVLPDYSNTSQPIQFPYKYNYANCPGGGWSTCNYGCTSTLLPITTPIAAEGFYIFTQQYAPFGGDYGYAKGMDYNHFFDSHNYYNVDSEPDLFSLNVPGGSIKFTLDWSYSGNHFTVLDDKGYAISYDGTNLLKVIFPSGEEYDFTRMNTVQTYSTSDGEGGSTAYPGGSSTTQPSSILWMLTKITTKNKKTITFSYTIPSTSYNCFPSYTQKGMVDSLTSTVSGSSDVFRYTLVSGNLGTGVGTTVLGTRCFSTEHYVTLNSITYQKGQVNFYTDTSRNDLLGGSKLDSVTISSASKVKSVYFKYSYFDATSVGGNTYAPLGTVNFGTHPLYRLRLDFLTDNSGARYQFAYNATQLPAKNSFAIDYWGYYNGKTTNATVVPNGSQFVNASLAINQSAWGNNGDNHSANLTYAQAGMLTQLTYPTGGSVNFTYELNQFNNYWVPDYANSSNTVSSGNGLRIKTIRWNDATGGFLKQTNYSYTGGISITPLNMFRQYNMDIVYQGDCIENFPPTFAFKVFRVNESDMTGFFSSNPLASVNGVGYYQVTKTDVNSAGVANGKEVQYYANTPDLTFNNTVETLSQVDANLPAYKDPAHLDNGRLTSDFFYDGSNNLLHKITNQYTNVSSPIFYGARLFGYGYLCTWNCAAGSGSPITFPQQLWAQNMVGYYPIFDFKSLVSSSTVTDYFGTDSVINTTANTYDTYNQITNTSKTNSSYTQNTGYTYPYNYPSNTILTAMTSQNRLSDIVTFGVATPTSTATFTRNYRQVSTLFVPDVDNDYPAVGFGNPNVTSYDLYDASNGNILQYSKNNVPNSVLWDYNKEYVVASVKNALYTNVAYTSFESTGTGRWKYSGAPITDNTAPTGTKVYNLYSGNIYRDSLSAALTYIVSYWSNNGAQTVSGSSGTKTGYTINGYTYYEHTVIAPTGGTITISGYGNIDELRLYPNTAQMTSYTYIPLVGLNSQDNEGGKISYYDYDNTNRLLDIRDQNRNIVKAFCYNYAGQATNCQVNLITPVINSVAWTYTGNNALITFTSIPNCTSAVLKYTNISAGTSGTCVMGTTSPATVAMPSPVAYSITITCYSNAYPAGTTSTAIVLPAND